jgi:hypothetical protein
VSPGRASLWCSRTPTLSWTASASLS